MSNVATFPQPAPKPRRPKSAETGVERLPDGKYRVWVKVLGRAYSKRFPAESGKIERRDWRAATRTAVLIAAQKEEDEAPAPGTFAEDVHTYLAQVRTMPTFVQRERHLREWLAALGPDRTRASITPADIRTVLQRLRAGGRPVVRYARDGEGRSVREIAKHQAYSASACNHRRTALMHFFTILDGKHAANPVRQVDKFREPDPEPRGLPMDTVARLLEAMGATKNRARAAVLAYTGIPHIQIEQIAESHVDEAARQVYVLGRMKGRGTKARIVRLLPDGLEAFKLMKRYEAWGEFSRSHFLTAVHRACRKIGILEIRPYDLRHSFGTAAYKAGGDIGAVQKLLGHTSTKMTQRYTLGADDARITATLDALAAQLTGQAGTKAGRSTAGKQTNQSNQTNRGRTARRAPRRPAAARQ